MSNYTTSLNLAMHVISMSSRVAIDIANVKHNNNNIKTLIVSNAELSDTLTALIAAPISTTTYTSNLVACAISTATNIIAIGEQVINEKK